MKTYGGVEVSLRAFLTSAVDGGQWSASRTGRFTYGKEPPVPIAQEAGWGPEPVWTGGREKESLPLPKIEPWSSSP